MASNNQGTRRGDDILSFPDNPTVLLDGPGNYLRWSLEIKSELKKKEMQWMISESEGRPPQVTDGTYEHWKGANQRILSYIRRSISKGLRGNSEISWKANPPPAFQVWKNLKQLYSPSDAFMIVDIKEQICSLRQETQTSLDQYLNKFDVLWTELETLGHNKCTCNKDEKEKVREEEKLLWLLRGLDRSFNEIRSQIMREDRLPPFNEAVALIKECFKTKKK